MPSIGPLGSRAFNVHNQNLPRAKYQGARGSGFQVQFLRKHEAERLQSDLERDGLGFQGAAIDSVVKTTDDVKQRIRTYLDSVFLGSEMHGNMHRRVANAASQSVYYDDREEKGQFTGLIYSKFGRGRGPSNFVDFMLLHVRGGTVTPQGEWLRIPNRKVAGGFRPQSGRQALGSDIFFTEVEKGRKLLQMRRRGKKVELIATLVKSMDVAARAGGVDDIASTRESTFFRYFDAAMNGQGLGEARA